MKGENNHQFGLLGIKNSSWKSDERISFYGYKLIRCLNHPFVNCDGFVFEHRLVAEKYLLTEDNSIIIDEKRYLKKDYIVHHLDFNRKNNEVSNLKIMLRSDHAALHSQINNDLNMLKQYCVDNNLNYDIVYENHLYNIEHYKYKTA